MSTWRAKVLLGEVHRLRRQVAGLQEENGDLFRHSNRMEKAIEDTEDNSDAIRLEWVELNASIYAAMKEVADLCSRFGVRVAPPVERCPALDACIILCSVGA